MLQKSELADSCGVMPHSKLTHLCGNNAKRTAKYKNDAEGHLIMSMCTSAVKYEMDMK
jgi:hypothetical protein